MEKIVIPPKETEDLFNKLTIQGAGRGYFLNHNEKIAKSLCEALLKNEKRYGHQLCPCRLTSGSREGDLDVICPCDYRDPDLLQYGVCYCGLYVSKKIFQDKTPTKPIPERRPNKETRLINKQKYMDEQNQPKDINKLPYPIMRCSVCGYICARADAPEVCPICGASHDRFQRFI
ncbi:MAG TPA: ferredoxin-thioredoxin reductase catalytic domain-containing protein [Candidatus Nanoarchaeia archaeon]|nr:ferredoxin-thioredoxin reductase catalytic domain-containing protein [Candidatus Nanoarchaeia archaeon]